MLILFSVFFFNDTATTEIYTLSLHDALPISTCRRSILSTRTHVWMRLGWRASRRSEEHTSELQSRQYLVCRLLLEKKKNTKSRKVIRREESYIKMKTCCFVSRAHTEAVDELS